MVISLYLLLWFHFFLLIKKRKKQVRKNKCAAHIKWIAWRDCCAYIFLNHLVSEEFGSRQGNNIDEKQQYR
jgi:hypothetical protein